MRVAKFREIFPATPPEPSSAKDEILVRYDELPHHGVPKYTESICAG
jgi:hypothetical protein